MSNLPKWFERIMSAVDSYLPFEVEFLTITKDVVAVLDGSGEVIGQVYPEDGTAVLRLVHKGQPVMKTFSVKTFALI
jgi:hypothetical protein